MTKIASRPRRVKPRPAAAPCLAGRPSCGCSGCEAATLAASLGLGDPRPAFDLEAVAAEMRRRDGVRLDAPAAASWPSSPDLDGFTWELGPDPVDDQWHAEQSTDHHATEPTPAEVLDDDGPEPDWDALAEESAAQDLLERGLVMA